MTQSSPGSPSLDALANRGLGELFVADVDNGPAGIGRDALRGWFHEVLAGFYRSMHVVSGHVVSGHVVGCVDDDHATGKVYCRAEHEDGDRWVIMTIVYHDDYRRDDGVWYFRRRRLTEWYAADVLERPQAGPLLRWPGRPARDTGRLPNLFPTWDPFREAAGADVRDRRTSRP